MFYITGADPGGGAPGAHPPFFKNLYVFLHTFPAISWYTPPYFMAHPHLYIESAPPLLKILDPPLLSILYMVLTLLSNIAWTSDVNTDEL